MKTKCYVKLANHFLRVLFMKFILLVFCASVGSLAFSAFAGESNFVGENDSLVDSMMKYEEMQVGCDNIVMALQSYIDLSEKNNSLLGISANRFSSAVSSGKTDEEMRKLEVEISHSAQLMQDNQFILSDKAYAIMDVLPDCLKK